MRKIIAAVSLSLASPVIAAQSAPPAAEISPANLEMAQGVIDLVWPLGTFQRVMDATMEGLFEQSVMGAMDFTLGQAAAMSGEEADPAEADKKLGDAMRELDPHFEERMKLSMTAFNKEFSVILTTMEPDVRQAMARIYAKRFTVAELEEMRTFFSTPTGRRYASESLTLMQDPEFLAASMSFQPMLIEKMPEIVKKVEQATAHLPPPPQAEGEEALPEDFAPESEELQTEEEIS